MRFRSHADQIRQAAIEEVMPLVSQVDQQYLEGVLVGLSIALDVVEKN